MIKERVERKLEKSGRITPREVLEAYEETGLTPGFGCYLEDGNACGVGVLMARDGTDMNQEVAPVLTWLEKTGRLMNGYTVGFYDGFDGFGEWEDFTSEERKGYRDGKRVRRFVLSRFSNQLEDS